LEALKNWCSGEKRERAINAELEKKDAEEEEKKNGQV
jgi:hypothetical protein